MNCNELNAYLALGDEADPKQREAAEQHLASCEECRKVSQGFEAFKGALHDAYQERDSSWVRESVLEAAREQAAQNARDFERKTSGVRRRRLLVAASLAGSIGVAAFLAGRVTAPATLDTQIRDAEKGILIADQDAIERLQKLLKDPRLTDADRREIEDFLSKHSK